MTYDWDFRTIRSKFSRVKTFKGREYVIQPLSVDLLHCNDLGGILHLVMINREDMLKKTNFGPEQNWLTK